MFPEGRALEFLLTAVIALIVVGPKDLPLLMRKLGQFMAKMRGMAAEFRASFDEMARQSELDELRREVEAMRSAQLADINQSLGEVSAELHAPTYFDGMSEAVAGASPDASPHAMADALPPPTAEPARKPRAKRAAAEPKPKAAATPRKAAAARKPASKPRAKKIAEPKA